MTYPQSGPGYGQGEAGQSAYGQQQYGQQAGYGQQQYGDQQYGDQAGYGQQQYGQQAGYGQQQYGQQQYGQQAGYGGYQAPKPPSQGLPANTPTILAAVIGGLGVITLFLGFLSAGSFSAGSTDVSAGKVFEGVYAVPWGLIAVAGLLAATTFLIGSTKSIVAALVSLTGVGALGALFVLATGSGKGGLGASDSITIDYSVGAGAIILLVFAILAFAASIMWLLIEGGQIKTAPGADAAAAAAPVAQPAAAPVADASAYGSYGQQAQQAQQPATYGQSAQPTYGQPAASAYGEPTSSPSNPVPGDAGATTAFQKPDNQQ